MRCYAQTSVLLQQYEDNACGNSSSCVGTIRPGGKWRTNTPLRAVCRVRAVLEAGRYKHLAQSWTQTGAFGALGADFFVPAATRLCAGDSDVFIGLLSVGDGGTLSDFQRGNVASN